MERATEVSLSSGNILYPACEHAVRQQHALRVAGGAGGVDQDRDLAPVRLVRLDRGSLPGLLHGGQGIFSFAVDDEDLSQLRTILAEILHLVMEGRVPHEEELDRTVFNHILPLLRQLLLIHGNEPAAQAVDRVFHHEPLDRIAQDETDGLALL
jgi:hypothetical protein